LFNPTHAVETFASAASLALCFFQPRAVGGSCPSTTVRFPSSKFLPPPPAGSAARLQLRKLRASARPPRTAPPPSPPETVILSG